MNDPNLFQLLQYSFVQKAFFAGAFIAVACSSLGLFLVLKKMSLIGDGLSHISFGAIALGLFLGIYPFYTTIPIVIIAALLILRIEKKARLYGDAAIGIISSVGIAGGVILAGLARGFNVDLFSYLFGNILTVSKTEIILSIFLSVLILFIIRFFYWELFSATFDEEYAAATGVKTEFLNNLLAILTAVTVVLSIKVAGIMLISALLILPAATALQISKSFKNAFFLSALTAIFAVFCGLSLSLILNWPSGASIVMTNFFLFLSTLLYKKIFR